MLSDTSNQTHEKVCDIFNSAQHSAAGHRKLIQTLLNVHRDCANNGGAEGERGFFMSLVHCMNVMLSVRRSEEVVTRCVRFLVGFIVLSAEKDETSVLGGPSPTTRLIENLMLYALEGVDSKERWVRVRLGQLMVACVNSVDELSDNVWAAFREKMTERLFDKEAAVRVQAVHAMSRLQGLSLPEDQDGGDLSVLDIFLELLAHDPSADVRKAVLGHIEVNERTMESILLRRRDVDVSVRKCFYERKMAQIDVRTLSISQRDAILRSGLRDRDSSVRRACVEMVFGSWIKTANNNLIMLLLSLDVIRNLEVAEWALRSFYEMVPDMFPSFPPAYLQNLTPETAIALRVYCERAGPERAPDLLPEMTELASYIRHHYVSQVSQAEMDEARLESDFIIMELFKTSRLLDRTDEVGRRVLQELIVEMLSNLELTDQVFMAALDLLIHLTPDLGDFLQISGQLVSDLHDLYSLPDGPLAPADDLQRSLESLTIREERLQVTEDVRIMAQLRCQEIVAAVYKLPGLSMLTHPVLLDLVNDVVIPAVNSHYAAIQEKGLGALGLACLLCRDLAEEYMSLFVEFYLHGQEDSKVMALKIIFDLLFAHGNGDRPDDGTDKRGWVREYLAQVLPSLYASEQSIQTVSVQGFAKLLLHHVIEDVTVITGLFQLYFHPATASNSLLRQSLSYFFPAFSYSSTTNQALVAASFVPVMEAWLAAENDTNTALSPLQVANQLVELTDPALLIEQATGSPNLHTHATISEAIAWAALRHWEDGKGRGRLYGQILARLRIDNSWPPRSLKRLLFVLGHLMRVVTEKVTQTALKKVVALLVELDDPSILLEPDDLADLRQRLEELALPETRSTTSKLGATPRATTTTASLGKKAAGTSTLTTVNMMDEIDDLLE